MALSVDAGPDQVVNDATPLTLVGVSTIGSAPISKKLWTKDSGPDCVFTAGESYITQVFQLYAGTYVFRLTVTDQLGNTASDTVSVTVSHTSGPIYRDQIPGAVPDSYVTKGVVYPFYSNII